MNLDSIFKRGKLNKSKHDQVIRNLKKRLVDYEIFVCSRYLSAGIDGEVDLLAVKDNYVLNFEIKSRKAYTQRRKAIKQLNRTNEVLKRFDYRVFNFFVSPKQIEWIH